MGLNAQKVAPMSRTLKNPTFCGVSINETDANPAVPVNVTNAAHDIIIGLDGVSVMANSVTTCSAPGAINGIAIAGSTFNIYPGGDTTQAPSGTYTVNSKGALDILKIVYGGESNRPISRPARLLTARATPASRSSTSGTSCSRTRAAPTAPAPS